MALTKKRARWDKVDVFDLFTLAPIEKLTWMLNQGEEVSDENEAFIGKLIRRTDALKAAYEMRLEKEGQVIE